MKAHPLYLTLMLLFAAALFVPSAVQAQLSHCGTVCDCDSSCTTACFELDFYCPPVGECTFEEVETTCGAWGTCTTSNGCGGGGACNNLACTSTINGDANNNTINGTSAKECIYGFGGNDTIDGNAGDDRIYGGNGTDTLYGDSGNDCLWGEGGSDHTDGESGTDFCDGETEANCEY